MAQEQNFTMSNERPSQVIKRLRKAGNLDQAWEFGVGEVQRSPNDNYLKGAFFWVCYDYLKSVQNPIIERGKTSKNYAPQEHEKNIISQYLDWVQWLNLPVSGLEYSRLLILFRNNAEYFPQIINLVLTHRLSLFDEEARTPFALEKGEMPSLLLSYARKLGQSWIEGRNRSEINLEALLYFMNEARAACKDRQHIMWLDYDQAKCLVLAKRYAEARELVIPILKKKQRESWAWGALASTYRESDLDAAISLYSQGVNCAHDDSFALPLLRALVLLFKSKGLTNEASMCLKRALACYEEKGWRVKPDLQSLQAEPWYVPDVDLKQLPSVLNHYSKNAIKYLHGETVKKVGLVVAIHQSKKGCNVYLAPRAIVSVPMFTIKGTKPKIGDYLQLEVPADDVNGDIISAKIVESESLEGVSLIMGELRVTEKGFGFVNDVFIPPYLINEHMNAKVVEVLCYTDLDRKKGVLGQKAATVRVVNVG